VEIQRVKQEFFKDRTLYYSSFAIQEQALKGKDWHYQLKAVYAIAIMDFIFDDTDENTLHHEVMLMDVRKKTVFYEKLTFIYLEIPKFNKNLQELNSNYERWLYAFRNLHRLQEKPVELQKGVFEKLFRQAEIAKMNKTDRDVYEESLKDYRDLKSSMVTYFAEGKQEGLKEGVEIGKEEGLRVGIEKGIEQKEKEVVLESFAEGLSPALIVKITKLTAEKVNVILRQAGLL
jgi:predicted transposase/invertase (TIGR01784 family)